MKGFLPISKIEMDKLGWEQLDIIIVSGDAYVDHPAWAAALLGKFLVAHGFKIGIIPQPRWETMEDISVLGRPRLAFAVSGGNLDSMVSHYTADKKPRRQDVYSPAGEAGKRPDRATVAYCRLIKKAFPDVPIIIGGIEASLRRLAHYDYWEDKIRPSILIASQADLLVYGMGEYLLLEIAKRLDQGSDIKTITDLRGTCYQTTALPQKYRLLPELAKIEQKKESLNILTKIVYEETNPYNAQVLAQKHKDSFVIQNPPPLPLSTAELDRIYEQDFVRKWHPSYGEKNGIPGLEPVQFSIVTHRGCFGGCSFCSLALHQGRFIQSRSSESIIKEIKSFISHDDFKGFIPDIGGPSANMYGLHGKRMEKCQVCRKQSCLCPHVCTNIETDQTKSVELWQQVRAIPGVKQVRISSGIRYDLLLKDKSDKYMEDLCRYHVGGQLKVAPEHVSLPVTSLMNKPAKQKYQEFVQLFNKVNRYLNKKQYLVPYFISAHPGCTLQNTIELAEFVRDDLRYQPEQVQNFTPTPMTISTAMYYSEIDYKTNQPIHVPKSEQERNYQRALLQYKDPKNKKLLREALEAVKRPDLIGTSPNALLHESSRKIGKKVHQKPAGKQKNTREKREKR